MKARHLYVFGHEYGSDTETKNVCDGLMSKYSPRSETACLYEYAAVPNLERKEEPGSSGPFEHSAGAYIVFHEISPDGDMMELVDRTPSHLVNEVLKPAMGDRFSTLEKVVFIACRLAHKREKLKDFVGQQITEIEAIKDRGYILSVLLELRTQNVNPKLVGWDSFISVLPYADGNVHKSPSNKGQSLNEEELKAAIGRKLGKGRSLGLMSNQYRAEHKRTFWVEDGRLLIDGSQGWS